MKVRFAALVPGLAMIAAMPVEARAHQIAWDPSFREVRVASKLKVAECPSFRGRQLSRQLLLEKRKELPGCPQFRLVGEAHKVPMQGVILFYVLTDRQEVKPGEYKIDPQFNPATSVDLTKKMY